MSLCRTYATSNAIYNLMELTLQDTEKLHQSIQEIYTLRDLDTFGVDAISIVDQLVPSAVPSFFITQARSPQISFTYLPDFPGLSSQLQQILHQHLDEHPIVRNMPRTLDGTYKTSDFITQAELHRLEKLYHQFLRVLDVEDQMFFFLPKDNPASWRELCQTNSTLVGVLLNRTQRNFNERDRLILNLLRPHLFQAYGNAQHYQQLQQDLSQLQQSLDHLGLVILDTEGKVQLITPQAIQWLQMYFAQPSLSQQLPDHLWGWIKHQVACFTKKRDLSDPCLPLRIQYGSKHLVIRLVIEQFRERYLLLLEEQTLSLLDSLKLLGLSQRETEVLFWVIQGKDNKAIAVKLSVNKSTVGKHLESIYRRLGVQSRTEAIAQTLEKLGFLNFEK